MKRIRTILVTTDYSDYSRAGLEYALPIAAQFRADIHLLHVAADKPKAGPRREQERAAEVPAQSEMQSFIAEHVDEYTCVKGVILHGADPAAEIVRYARENDIDMIVIATHGRTGFRHMVVGSIAEKVVRLSTVPVLAVKPTAVCEQILLESDVLRDLRVRTS